LKNGSSQGQDLALTVSYVPTSLDSGGTWHVDVKEAPEFEEIVLDGVLDSSTRREQPKPFFKRLLEN
jgi:hypothetical protein